MDRGPVIALSGGVGGAKLALGLSHLELGDDLLVVANVGDDFEHLGLSISPDLDTVTYTLSGLNDQEKGWGRVDEGWRFMDSLGRFGGEDWFNLGDRDLALHILRTQALQSGDSLSDFTYRITNQLGITTRVVPMSDDTVRTIVHTEQGDLAFQNYFVRDKCEPAVEGFEFLGLETARPQTDFMEGLTNSALQAVIITPSNPFVSIDPILKLSGVSEALRAATAPVIAVSPIVAGMAIKGPAAKMMAELGMPNTALAVAEHYGDLLDGFVLDTNDRIQKDAVRDLGVQPLVTKTVMQSLDDRIDLAREVMSFARMLCG